MSQLLTLEPDLLVVVREFVAGLPASVNKIRAAFERLDWDELRVLAHRLKGAGGSYGYPEMSAAAARMEEAFLRHEGERFGEWVRELEGMVEGARRGLEQ